MPKPQGVTKECDRMGVGISLQINLIVTQDTDTQFKKKKKVREFSLEYLLIGHKLEQRVLITRYLAILFLDLIKKTFFVLGGDTSWQGLPGLESDLCVCKDFRLFNTLV